MSKYTPGPWEWLANGDANDYVLLTHDNRWVMAFRQNGEQRTPEQEANARLIAAAPDLLETLEDMLGWQTLAPDDVVAAAREVVAKARGEI